MKRLKLEGLTRRYVVNVLSIIFLFLLLFSVFFIFSTYNYYYQSITQSLSSQLNTVATFFGNYASGSEADFEEGAQEFVEGFRNRDRMEIQFIDNEGHILVTTSGFPPNQNENLTDFNKAMDAKDGTASWRGKLSSGESIMAMTAMLSTKDNADISIGAVRAVISLRETNHQLWMIVLIVLAASMVIFTFVLSSGWYFVKSIISPVRAINSTARQIALGDFDARIDTNSTDEIGQLCDTINYMAGELDLAERMKNEFISSVSHELRTPLTAIKGWGETIRDAGGDADLTQKGVEVIIKESERLSGIVEDLLDFSRIQNGQLSFQMIQCDLVAELSEAVLTFTDIAHRSGVELLFEERDDIPLIQGDGARLQQVFVNVIDNAIKYTPQGGKILVDIRMQGGKVVVMISDTGCGIPEDELQKVTQKFYKGKKATRGSGIGLAVAEEIIKKHGGLLDVASTEHVGTTVTITLPVTQKADGGEIAAGISK